MEQQLWEIKDKVKKYKISEADDKRQESEIIKLLSSTKFDQKSIDTQFSDISANQQRSEVSRDKKRPPLGYSEKNSKSSGLLSAFNSVKVNKFNENFASQDGPSKNPIQQRMEQLEEVHRKLVSSINHRRENLVDLKLSEFIWK